MTKLFDLTNRVAVVTGANRGIGLALAKGLATAGAAVVLAVRDAAKGASAAAELTALGLHAAAVELDVISEGSCNAMVRQAIQHFGRIDILVNNAGINIRARPENLSVDDWSHVLATNLTGPFLCSRATYLEMKRRGGGKIINIASILSTLGEPMFAAYCASKGGLLQLTKCLAVAWAPDNIQVNALLAGWIDTDLSRAGRSMLPELDTRVTLRTPSGRWGVTEDLIGATVFLASSASDFVTGTALTVDGGYSAT